MCSSDCLLAIIAIIFPPLPVWVKRGLCSIDSLINIALLLLGFIPGLIHSWYIITTTPDDWHDTEYERVPEAERGTVYHVYHVQHDSQPQYGSINNGQGSVQNQSSSQNGPRNEIPPSYADAVKGDHKVQGP